MFLLSEELFLLSIDDKSGKIVGGVSDVLKYGMAGALVAELALQERVNIESKRLTVSNPALTGEPLLDYALVTITSDKKIRKINHWIQSLGDDRIIKRVVEGLEAKKMIRIEKKRFLWVIPLESFPQVDASAKFFIKQHLREAVLANHDATPGIVTLLSLLNACDMLNLVFTRDEQKAARKKVETMASGEMFGAAVAETLAEIEATMAAVIAVIATTSVSS